LLWCAALPFEAFLSGRVGISPYVALTPLVLLALALPALLRDRWSHGMALILVGASIMVLGLLSAAVGFGPVLDPPRLRAGVAVLTLAVIAQGIASCSRDERFVRDLAVVLAVSAICAAAIGWQTSGLSWRISIADSVRQLANVAGLGAVLAVAVGVRKWVARQPDDGDRNGWIVTLLWMMVAGVLMTIVVATISRGVVGATLVAILAIVVMTLPKGLSRGTAFRSAAFVSGVAVMGLILWRVTQALDQTLAGGRISGRIVMALNQPDGNPRWAIWRAGLGDRTPGEWVVGSGIGQFEATAAMAGLDYYAHSVWVDALAAVGVIGLLALAAVATRAIAVGLVARDVRVAGVAAFMLASFATHGSLGTKGFWLALGLLWGMSWAQSGTRRTITRC
jgi:hypothetical protein